MRFMDLTPAQKAILLHLYEQGDDVPANISDARDYHRNYVVSEAKELLDEGYIINKGHGVYRLTPDGRETARDLANE